MALLFMDGFDAYATAQIVDKWTNSTQISGTAATIATPGRFGAGNRLDQTYTVIGLAPSVTKSLIQGPQSAVVCGFAWMYGQTHFLTPGTVFWALFDASGTVLGSIVVNAAGGLEYHLGLMGTLVVASNPGIVNVQAWGHIGIDVTLSATSGSVTLYFNGTQVATISSVPTSVNSNGCSMLGPTVYATASGDNPGTQSYDDVYIFNHSTSFNNAYAGDCECLSQMPIGDGHETAWSEFPGSGSNWQKIDEIPPDGDTTYIFDDVVNDSNANTVATLTNVATVLGVQICVYARKDNSPARSIGIGWSDGSTDVIDAGHFLNTSYTYELSPLDQDPVGPANWTPTLVNTGQAVVKVLT